MIICADDYGISEAVSKGIIELIDCGSVTATSCMVNGSRNLKRQMDSVVARENVADIGLHLTLTDGCPLSEPKRMHGLTEHNGQFLSYRKLLVNSYTGRVDRSAVETEIRAQISRFGELTGFLPAFVDGHQHAHQLPVIRDTLVQVCTDMMRDRFYIRCATFPTKWLVNSSVPARMRIGSTLIGLPAFGFRKILERSDIRCNSRLLGHYSGSENLEFERVFESYLRLRPGTNDIFYVHPGYVDAELKSKDPLIDERISELQYLRSPRFTEAINKSGTCLNRFQY